MTILFANKEKTKALVIKVHSDRSGYKVVKWIFSRFKPNMNLDKFLHISSLICLNLLTKPS